MMPNDKDFSVEDEAYLHAVAAEPKMTTDELVGDDGNPTLDPSTAKGSLANALDEALSADTDLEHTTITRDRNDGLDAHLTDPTDDFRDETKGEVEGTTDTPQNLLQPIESNKVNEGLKPMIQQDAATNAKESLAYALDSITMDGAEEIEKEPPKGKDPVPDYSDYSEENASHINYKAPNIPSSLGGEDDKPDANGLVYVSATFTVDPEKYISNNYRPSNTAQAPDAQDVLKKASAAMRSQGQQQADGGVEAQANPEEEEALSDLGTPEAKESAMQPDEPTEQQEEQAAKAADKEQQKEIDAEEEEERKAVIPKPNEKADKPTQDEAPDKVVLDYATFIDGSSFMCFDEISDIDYTKIAMDAGPKKPVTRENCQTTFAQCRAKNPLFCRFHGPKLLEADIKTAIKATVGNGCLVSVTKDTNAKNKFTFRLTVGCPPSKKMMVEKMVHMYLTQNPGITSATEDWNLAGKHKQTLEFDMDILRADKPPEKNDLKGKKSVIQTKKDKAAGKVQGVVGETSPALEKKAAKGEKWQTVDEAVESEWADIVDKTVNKSLLGNNEEFMDAFNKIANDFDAAHDKGDAQGLKKALDTLKAEIAKYDENGEKKEGADGGEAEAQPTEGTTTEEKPTEAPQPAEQPTQPTEAPQEEEATPPTPVGKPKGKGKASPAGYEKPANFKGGAKLADTPQDDEGDGEGDAAKQKDETKGFTPPDPNEDPNFYEAWNDAYEPELTDDFEKAKASVPEGIGNAQIDPLISDFEKAMKNYDYKSAKKAIEGLTALANGDNGGGSPSATTPADKGDSVKLPPISRPTKPTAQKQGGGDSSQAPSKPQTPEAKKVADLISKVDGLSAKAKELGIDGNEDVANHKKNCAYHIQGVGYSTQNVDHLTAKLQAEEDKPDSSLVELAKTCLTNALQSAKDALESNIQKLENATQQFADYLDTYQKDAVEKTKLESADSVEASIKSLSNYIYGGKRPPQGVDSLTDYLDYEKEGLETDGEGEGSLTPDEMAEIEDKYHMEDAYKATKEASKKLDSLIEEFKDKMDNPPTQSEDYGSYQGDLEQMKKAISAATVEVMASHDAYKGAIEKSKYEIESAKKLAASKKKLQGGDGKKPIEPFDFNAWQGQQKKGGEAPLGTDGSSGAAKSDASSGEVTKEDIMDFFDDSFDESEGEQQALQMWLDMANKGIYGSGKASDYFASMGGWLQQKMQKKGADHPVTKAFHKWGLNLPKGMEETKPVEESQDLSYKVGNTFSGLQHDIKPFISKALSKNGNFTNFDTFDGGNVHFISMEKKQKEGFDEDKDDEVAPTNEELETLQEQMNEEFNKHGLSVKPSTTMKNFGKKVYFEVGKAEKGKQASNTSSQKTEEQTIDDITTAVDTAMHGKANDIEFYTGGGLKELSAKYFGTEGVADIMHEMSAALKPLGYEAWVDADSDTEYNIKINKIKGENGRANQGQSAAKTSGPIDPKPYISDDEKKKKIAAMSPKQKLEAAVKIFKKKIAADPNNAEAKAKLAKYEAMLSKLGK